jgi:glyoxylase-like metal-dependent hydrolase (beta-lactamase superfamily II)
LKAGYFFTNFPYYDKFNNQKFLKSLSFVIDHPEYGPMIFDTGTPHDTDTTSSILKKQFNLDTDDMKWVFITHIHPDHTGSNFLFKKAKIVISKEDFLFSKRIANIVFSKGDLKSFLYENCPGYKNYYDDIEIEKMKNMINDYWSEKRFGIGLDTCFIEDNPPIPPFIRIMNSPGHTFHHKSYMISGLNPGKNIYITGDSISNRHIINSEYEDRLNEPHMDFSLFDKTITEFRNYDGVFVPGHDRPFYYPSRDPIKNNIFEIEDL